MALFARCAIAIAASIGLAAASPPASPACGLLSQDEANGFVGGTAQIEDGGPEVSGVSACGWREKAKAAYVGVQAIGPVMFTSADTTAPTYYDLIVKGMQSAKQNGEDVAGVGDKAFLVTTGTAELPSFVLTLLKGDKLATVAAIGMDKPKAIAVAQAVAGKL